MKTRFIVSTLVFASLVAGGWWLSRPQQKEHAIEKTKTAPLSAPVVFHSSSVTNPAPMVAAPVSAPMADEVVKVLEGRALQVWVSEVFAAAERPESVRELIMPDGEKLQVSFTPAAHAGSVQGVVVAPSPGRFTFSSDPHTGDLTFGVVAAKDGSYAYHTEHVKGGGVRLVATTLSEVVCATDDGGGLPLAPESELEVLASPIIEDHPDTSSSIPAYQNGIVSLQSNPAASVVIYLDFDGESGPFNGWGNFEAAHSGLNNSQIKNVWQWVAEAFVTFSINVTTDKAVFDAAFHRQRCIITPTKTALGTSAGVAYINSFDSGGYTPCWALPYTGETGGGVIAHELGHTLGLAHDGHGSSSYYGGIGSGAESWGPIMGTPYGRSLKHWSPGDYANSTNTQDDRAIIGGGNWHFISYRADEIGDTTATAETLRLFSDGSVDDSQIIESRTDKDYYKFRTSGGNVALNFSRNSVGGALNIEAALYDSSGAVITSINDENSPNVSLTSNIAAGDYYISVKGAARTGTNSFSDYGSLGGYKISGSITNGVAPQRLTVDEGSTPGSLVGHVTTWEDHGASTRVFTLQGGNTDHLFEVDATTGAITVAAGAVIDYETLAANWRKPPEYVLHVQISSTGATETRAVFVSVQAVNGDPVFISDPVVLPAANLRRSYFGSLAGLATDANHPVSVLTFAKVGGPSWLKVAADGTLSGVPGEAEVGTDSFTVSVTDPASDSTTATLQIPVNGGAMATHLEFADNVQDRMGPFGGTATGSPEYTDSVLGRAIVMDGSDDTVTLPAGVADTADITLAVRFRWDGGDQWQRIYDFGNDTGHHLFLTPRSSSETLRFGIVNGAAEQFLDTEVPTVGQWVQVVVTLVDDIGCLYVDGVLKDTKSITIDPSSFNPSVNFLGDSQYTSDPLFIGAIDDLRIYHRGLSAFEIGTLAAPAMDSDADGFSDDVETDAEADSDGTANYLDVDSDNDGLDDSIELFVDSDSDGLLNIYDPDNDNDGAPDGWEITYGFDPLSAADGALDEDLDGQSNASEYAAGTSPVSSSSYFKVTSSAHSGEGFTVTVAGVASRSYKLQRCGDLATDTWQEVATQGPLLADGTVVLTDSAPPSDCGFYRVLVSVP